jgi:hypothetical protein
MDEVCREGEQAARELWAGVGLRYWEHRGRDDRAEVRSGNPAPRRGGSAHSGVAT